MLGIPGNTAIFLYGEPTDMRKSFEGLCAIVEVALLQKPASGAYFVFLNRPKDRMKILYWDVDGLAIWYKRLERGRFVGGSDGKSLMTRQAFLMLLEGITPERINRRYKPP